MQKDLTYTYGTPKTAMYKGFQTREVLLRHLTQTSRRTQKRPQMTQIIQIYQMTGDDTGG